MGIIYAMKEESLGELAIELMNNADSIMEILSSVTTKMEELSSYVDGPVYQSLMAKYNTLKNNYSTVKTYPLTYSADLIEVMNIIKNGDREITFITNDAKDSMSEKVKEVKNGGV